MSDIANVIPDDEKCFEEFTKEDSIKLHDCIKAMSHNLGVAHTALVAYNRAKAEYKAIKERYTHEEEQIDDLVGAVYAGIVGAKRDV